MKKMNNWLYAVILAVMVAGCSLDYTPESSVAEDNFWNPEVPSDFEQAANGAIALLPANWLDLRGDDLFRSKYPNDISAGTRKVPATSNDWTQPFTIIFRANRIIQNTPTDGNAHSAIRPYIAEGHFCRAYAYSLLLAKFGGVPIMTRTAATPEDSILYQPRNTRREVVEFIYSDLDTAFKYLPAASELSASLYGRISKSAAMSLKARVALFEGTWEKYHCASVDTRDFEIAVSAAKWVIDNGGHTLYDKGSEPYKSLFDYEGEGCGEFILAKVYGFPDNQILTHNAPYQYCVNYCVSRALASLYLNSDGTEYQDNPSLDLHYNDFLSDRDPRLTQTVLLRGVQNYTLGPFVPSNPGFCPRKFVRCDGDGDQPSTLDWPLIRYAEVLLTYAEAMYEKDGNISDDNLNISINKLRDRVGMPHLTNYFVISHSMDMLQEIRREREVELALEGFRYDDIRRWKTAEELMPVQVLGAQYIKGEWGSISPGSIEEWTTDDMVFIIEKYGTRFFDSEKDYLYPIPSHDIAQSNGNLVQNPNWK